MRTANRRRLVAHAIRRFLEQDYAAHHPEPRGGDASVSRGDAPMSEVMSRCDAPPVWTYWEGLCPPYVELCLDSLRRHAGARVLDRASFDGLWTSDRDLPIDALYVAHRADYIRAYLLRHYGGFWIDADCVLLRPVAPLAALLDQHDLVTYREPAGSIANRLPAGAARRAASSRTSTRGSPRTCARAGRSTGWRSAACR